jgi:large subunit ribosomal protein L5
MTGLKINSQEYYKNAVAELLKAHKGANIFSVSSISKVSINIGMGKYKNDTKARTDIENYLAAISGQKPKVIESKVNVSGFKLRAGEPVGMVVTLRGKKMQDFLMNLIYVVLPRTRDFKGIKATSFDKKFLSYSLGIENSAIFPLVGFDNATPFGMQINIVFNKEGEQNRELLEKLNFPFIKSSK